MSDDSDSLWYQLGFALQEARALPSRERIQTLQDKLVAFRSGEQGSGDDGKAAGSPVRTNGTGSGENDEGAHALDWVISTVSGGAAAQLLRRWAPREQAGFGLLLRGAASGAAASLIQTLVAVLLADDDDEVGLDGESLLQRLLSGGARGLLYAAVAEPRLPGPPVLRGVLYGSVEYLLAPMGGVSRVLGRETPWGRIPVLRSLLDQVGIDEDRFVEHLVFGAALALMAGQTRGDSAAED